MQQLNIPSYNALVPRERIIRAIQELYSKVNDIMSVESEIVEALFYKDVYMGVAADYTDILNADNHYEALSKGTSIPFDTVSGYIWAVLPEDYSPTVAMSLVEVPMSLETTTTIDGKTYKIWKSAEEQTGSFNLYLF